LKGTKANILIKNNNQDEIVHNNMNVKIDNIDMTELNMVNNFNSNTNNNFQQQQQQQQLQHIEFLNN